MPLSSCWERKLLFFLFFLFLLKYFNIFLFTFLLHTSPSVDSFRTGPVRQSTRCPGLIQVKCYGQGLCVCVCASLSSCVLVYVTPGTGAQLTHDQRVLLPVSSTDTRLTGTDGKRKQTEEKRRKKKNFGCSRFPVSPPSFIYFLLPSPGSLHPPSGGSCLFVACGELSQNYRQTGMLGWRRRGGDRLA